jgi:hypothetical protein
MKKAARVILTFFPILICMSIEAQTLVGAGQTYTSLRTAFNAINNGTIKGNVVLKITSSITETASAVINASGSGSASYSSVTIYPGVSGVTIGGSFSTPLIDINGADNVTIDGRLNGTGLPLALTIKNSSNSSTSGCSTIRFRNSSESNIIRYCNIRGASSSTTDGIISFSTSTSGNGNINNSIDKNDITNDASNRPVNVVFSLGSTGKINSNIIISNNNFYNFLRAGSASQAINISSFSSAFTITGNSFYETSSFVPGSSVEYCIIRINNTLGVGFNISNNLIGGSDISCGGTAWTKTNSKNNTFYAIYLSAGTGTVSNIQGNTIANFSWSNSSSAAWTAISILSGDVNVGTMSGNIIGNSIGTASIAVTGSATGVIVTGIDIASTGNVKTENNIIGSITVINTNTRFASSFYGVNRGAGTGTTSIRFNTVGSITQNLSINATSASTNNIQNVCGIYSSGAGSTDISNNLICHLNNSCTGNSNSTRTRGILCTNGTNSISNNNISYISTLSTQTGTLANASLIGISITSTFPGQSLIGNRISYLSNGTGSVPADIYGIHFSGPVTGSNTVSGNFVHSLSLSTTATTADVYGIIIETGSAVCANNIVNLGTGVTTGYMFIGIADNCDANSKNKYYFNSVYLGGNLVSGSTSSTYAIYRFNANGTSDYKNNILFNARNGGTTGKHYSIGSNPNNITGLTIDFNDYFITGSNGILGNFGGNDKATLTLWRSVTSQDANSIYINPAFISAGSTTATDFKPTIALEGLAGTVITTDYAGLNRDSSPTIGAWELITRKWKGNISTDFGTSANWTNGIIPSVGDNILFDDAPERDCLLDINRIVGDIVNTQAQYKLVLNGKSLTTTGNLDLSNNATIDASSLNSTMVFSGTSAQLISNGSFLDNSVYNVVVNNSTGVTLNSDLTVTGSLTINAAKLFKVSPGKNLTVIGSIVNNSTSSGFILKSDISGTASLLHNTSNIVATIERNITGAPEAWHFLSAPVSDQSISGEWLPAGSYGNGTGYDLYVWDEVSGCWIYKQNTNTAVNWNTVHPESNFRTGKGYLYSVQEANPSKQFAGHLSNGTVTIPLTCSGMNLSVKGFNLTGNPYPSSLDWQSVSGWTRSALSSNGGGYDMWIWNPAANNYGIINSAGGTGTNGVTRYIAPMQGFFVLASANGNLIVTNSARVHSGAANWLKKGSISNERTLDITVTSEDGSGSDEILMVFGNSEDKGGSAKLFSYVASAPELYLNRENKDYSVCRFTDTMNNPSVPFKFKAGVDGRFTLKNSFDTASFNTVIMEDTKLNYFQDLKTNPVYTFISSVTDLPSRFVVHFAKSAIMKVDSKKESSVRVYTTRNGLIIDLNEIEETTDLTVTDITGRIIMRSNLEGNTTHTMNINSKSQALLVYLKNKELFDCKKIIWINK